MGEPTIQVPPDVQAKLDTIEAPRKKHAATQEWIRRRLAERSMARAKDQGSKNRIFEDIKSGKITVGNMMEATKADLEARFQNVAPIVDDDGEAVGYKFHHARTGKDHEWKLQPQFVRHIEHQKNVFKTEARARSGVVDPDTRGEAAHKITREGEVNRFREKYGAENVKVADGEIFVNDPGAGGFIPVERPLLEGGLKEVGADLYEMVGPAHELVPGIVAGVAGAPLGPLGAAGVSSVADALGGVQRQGIAHAIPGEEGIDATGRAALIGTNVAAGAVGEGVLAAGGKAFNRFASGPVRGRIAGEFAGNMSKAELRGKLVDAKRLEGRITGRLADNEQPFNLTLGQATGAREGLGREKQLRQAGGAPDAMADHFDKQALSLKTLFDRTVQSLSGGRATEAAGRKVSSAYKGHLEGLAKIRSKGAGPLFDAAEAVYKGKPVIVMNHTVEAVENLIEGNKGFIKTHEAEAITEAMNKITAGYKANGGDIPLASVREIQNSLRDLGAAARGSGQFIKDLGKSNDRRVSGLLFDAIQRDLDEATKGAALGGEGAQLLLDARNAWAKGSKRLDAARNTFLDGLVKAGDVEETSKGVYQFPERMLFGEEPAAIRDTVQKIAAADPEALADMQSRALGEMLAKAENTDGVFSPGLLKRHLLKSASRKRLNALLDATPDGRSAMMALDDIGQAIKQMTAPSDVPGGSQSVPLLLKFAALKQSGLPVVGPVAGALSETIGRALEPLSSAQGIASHVIDPAKRELVLGLVKRPKGKNVNAAERLARAANQLIALQSREATAQTAREEGPGFIEKAGRAIGHQILPGLINE